MWEKLAGLNWIPILEAAAGIIITVVAGLILTRLASSALRALGRRRPLSPAFIGLMTMILRWALLCVVILLVIAQLGINMGSLWAVLSALLAIVGIGFVAVWSILSNISSTFLLLIFHPFAVGDEIELIEATGGTGLRGKVAGLNFMYTTLEEKDPKTGQTLVTQVPNITFFQKTIRKWPGGAGVDLERHIMKKQEEPQRAS